jgi:hypothetical protein
LTCRVHIVFFRFTADVNSSFTARLCAAKVAINIWGGGVIFNNLCEVIF